MLCALPTSRYGRQVANCAPSGRHRRGARSVPDALLCARPGAPLAPSASLHGARAGFSAAVWPQSRRVQVAGAASRTLAVQETARRTVRVPEPSYPRAPQSGNRCSAGLGGWAAPLRAHLRGAAARCSSRRATMQLTPCLMRSPACPSGVKHRSLQAQDICAAALALLAGCASGHMCCACAGTTRRLVLGSRLQGAPALRVAGQLQWRGRQAGTVGATVARRPTTCLRMGLGCCTRAASRQL